MFKAILLFVGILVLTLLTLAKFGFSLDSVLAAAEAKSGHGSSFLGSGLPFTNKMDFVSLARCGSHPGADDHHKRRRPA